MAFFQRLHRSFRAGRGRRSRQRSEFGVTKLSASAPNVSAAVNSDAGARPRTASFASGDTHVASEALDTTYIKDQELVSPVGFASIDLPYYSSPLLPAAFLPQDVLPDILYGDADAETSCRTSVVTSYDRPLAQLKSSESYCSNLTDLTHVDDGLTDWGLPKVLVPSYVDEVYDEEQSATAASLPQDAPAEFDIESIFDYDLPLPTESETRTQTIVKTMSVVYLGLLLQRKGITPARYQENAKALHPRKSFFELQEENMAKQIELAFLANFVPVGI